MMQLRSARRLLASLVTLTACSATQVVEAPTVGADGLPLDWPSRPQVSGTITTEFPAEERLLVGSPDLGKGVQVRVVPRHDSPAVYLRWVIPGGRALEMTGKDGRITPRWPEGTVQLAAELAPMGTRTRPGPAFATQLANIGAQLDLIALPDAVIVDLHVLSHRLPQALGLVREALLEPELDGAQLESLKQRHQADLANEAQEPAAVADRLARRLLFGPTHPYGSLGLTLESVAKINRKHVQEAAATAFRLGGSHLMAVGDVDATGLADAVRKVFGAAVDVPASVVTLPKAASEATASGCHLVALPDASQTAIVLAAAAPRRADDAWPTWQLTNQLLGGSASSRLFDALREKRGIGYGASSRLEGRLVSGGWLVAANVRTEATVQALGVIQEELAKLGTTPPPDTELDAAKRYLAGQFALNLADGDDLADLLATQPLYHLAPEAQSQFLARVQEVAADAVPSIAARWPTLDGAVVVLAGQLDALRPAIDARCGRVVEHDAQGRIVRVHVGSDREMSDLARANAFALWVKSADGLAAMARYVTDPQRDPKFRAQALAVLGASSQSAQALPMGRKAADWPQIADELVQTMLSRLGKGTPEQNAELRATVLAMADGVTGTDQGPDLTPEAATAAKKQLAAWAMGGMAKELPPDALKLQAQRLADGDLARLGTDLPVDVLERWIASDVRRHEAAAALARQDTPEATAALVSGYRQFLRSGAVPDAQDLASLGKLGSLEGLTLLFSLHAGLERTEAVAAQRATMVTIRQTIDAMPPQKLAAAFDKLDPYLENLLRMRDADDRWWAAELLVTYRDTDGLRRVLTDMASDDHYQKAEWHAVDPKKALFHLANDVIVPLGPQRLQPLLLATLVRRQAMGKVIAVTVLKHLGDDASVQALKTLDDETDIATLLDLGGPLSVHELAMAAVDVCKYVAEVNALERAGKLSEAAVRRHKLAALATYDLTDKRLRAEVNRVVTGAPQSPVLAPAPDAAPAPEAAPVTP